MLELAHAKSCKINLSDYSYQRDIDIRLFLPRCSSFDFTVVQEILFSPLQFSLKKFSESLEVSSDKVKGSLKSFEQLGLLKIDGDNVSVDKELRKYFESQCCRFEDDFKPDMEFLQTLLKKVAIEHLPLWYAIPRTSNNIFQSIVEKYLYSPQTFQRYLLEFEGLDSTLIGIAQDVFQSKELKLPAEQLIKKYGLSEEKFQEYMLMLEFSLICCSRFERSQSSWCEVITPFYEWQEYLKFVKKRELKQGLDPSQITIFRPEPYAFIRDMTSLLEMIAKKKVSLNEEGFTLLSSKFPEVTSSRSYVERLIKKLLQLGLITSHDSLLSASEKAQEWLSMKEENKAIFLYRHPLNRIGTLTSSSYLLQEKTIREAEKSVVRVLHTGWVLFDEFIQGVLAPLTESNQITLKKVGRTWRYDLPSYTSEEIEFIRSVIFDWLFEIGITSIGTFEARPCFCVTPFGQSLFG